MTVTLDLNPALALQKRLSSGAVFTGAMIYLEGIVVLVLLTQTRFSFLFLIPIALVLAAQVRVVRQKDRPIAAALEGPPYFTRPRVSGTKWSCAGILTFGSEVASTTASAGISSFCTSRNATRL